nr:hypothetical protein [Clavibacter michiganensis]
MHAMFVVGAPFTSERQRIFDAFAVWMGHMSDLVPGCHVWVDGGYVTHKTWAAPKDVDVVIVVRPSQYNALTPAQLARFESLMTDRTGPAGQPMGGLVDAFLGLRGDPSLPSWRVFWANVSDSDGSPVDNETKGFLEVTT